MTNITQKIEMALRLAIRNAKACPMHFKDSSSTAVQHVKYCEDCEAIIVYRGTSALVATLETAIENTEAPK
jgi:hypothetical protein